MSSDDTSSEEHSEFEVSEEATESDSEVLSEHTSSNDDSSSGSDDDLPEKGECGKLGVVVVVTRLRSNLYYI